MMPPKPQQSQPNPACLELVLFNHARHLVEVSEAAAALKISEQHVRDLIDRGDLLALPINDEPNPKREHVRVQRFSIEGWFLERSENRNRICVPYRQSPEVSWWRAQLRQRSKGLSK